MGYRTHVCSSGEQSFFKQQIFYINLSWALKNKYKYVSTGLLFFFVPKALTHPRIQKKRIYKKVQTLA